MLTVFRLHLKRNIIFPNVISPNLKKKKTLRGPLLASACSLFNKTVLKYFLSNYLLSFVFIKLLLHIITCTGELLTSKVVFSFQMATDERLPAICCRKVLKYGAYVSGTQFSAATSISIWEPITSKKSETAIPRNIEGSRMRKTISGSRYYVMSSLFAFKTTLATLVPRILRLASLVTISLGFLNVFLFLEQSLWRLLLFDENT